MRESFHGNQKTSDDGPLQLLSFTSGGMEFGVDILRVQEIHEMVGFTRLPHAPAYVEGVTTLLGFVIPVIDLRLRLGMQKKPYDKESRIIVVESGSALAGFIVDAVKEVLKMDASVTGPPVPGVVRIGTEFVSAVGKVDSRLIAVLDLEKVLAPDGTWSLGPEA